MEYLKKVEEKGPVLIAVILDDYQRPAHIHLHWLAGKIAQFFIHELRAMLADSLDTVPGCQPLRSTGIDAAIFEDDDGKVYFANGGGGTICLLKDDLRGFAESHVVKLENPDHNPAHHAAKVVSSGMNGFGHEGAVLFKANGKCYHGAVDDYEGRYSSCVAIADNIWGPCTNWHETVPGGGGTDFFRDKEGSWWCAFFGNDAAAPWREMPGIVRVDFDPAGKIFVAKTQPAFILQHSIP